MSKWSEGAEGFICPYCLVSFNSSNKLQAHFIDFHSDEGGDAAVVLEPDFGIEQENDVITDGLGHKWKTSSLSKPRSCEACTEIIWSTSYTCQICQLVIHAEKKCQDQVIKVCVDGDHEDNMLNSDRLPRADAPPPPKAIGDFVKRQISKGKNRFTDDGFDLDLSYITERIIAMSFPGSGLESAYRNNLKDVAKMLKTRHQENYMIFNLSERSYDISKFNNQVLDFGWPDHLAPSLERLSIVCKSMKSWLDSDPQHVVVVHCKGGKGRTGCVIAAFMHYSQICQSASAALDHFAMKRFYDDKLQGVTQPSQRRYVHYFEELLAGKIKLDAPPVKLCHVLMHGIPNFDSKGGCRPFLKIYQNMELLHTSGLYVCPSGKDRVKISLYGGLKLEGEILVKCFHKRTHTGVDSIFRCQFHHSVVSDQRLVWTKKELDDAFKDKRFPDDVKVEFIFETANASNHLIHLHSDEPVQTDIRHSLLADRRRDSMMESFLIEPDAKRNSYAAFLGGYDHGIPEANHTIPDLIDLNAPPKHDPDRDRSSTNDSYHMDPALIERIAADDGELYTVVAKVNSRDNSRDPSPEGRSKFEINGKASPISISKGLRTHMTTNELELSSSPRYSHLIHNKDQPHPPHPKPRRAPPPAQYSKINKDQIANGRGHRTPSPKESPPNPPKRYDDVEGKKLVLTPVSPRQSSAESEMWMTVKWQTMLKNRGSSTSSQRSSSQTALDNLIIQEDYSNLSDLAVGGAFVTQQRRHSFTEGENSLTITSPTLRESIIPIDIPQGAVVGPKDAPIDEDIYTVPPDANNGLEQSDIYTVPPDAKDALYGNVPLPEEEDYVNYDAEMYSHDYSNEAELREHLRNNPSVPAGEEIKPATVIQQKVPAAGFKDIVLENLGIKKPATKTVIQSVALSHEERKQALPMFQLSGNNNRGLQVGRGDYMAFHSDSWVGRNRKAKDKSHDKSQDKSHDKSQDKSRDKSHDKIPSKINDKSPLPSHPPHSNKPQPPKKPLPLESPEITSRPLPDIPVKPNKKPNKEPPPKPPYPVGFKPHHPLQPVKSQPLIENVSEPETVCASSTSAVVSSPNREKPAPPPRPAPYQAEKGKSPPPTAVTQVKDLMSYWYRPSITREEACSLVKRMDAGSFIVRDSQTVSGGYALTIRVSKDLIRHRRKLTDDMEVTEDMCVTHFLIQPDPEGVKLQGWNEPAFKTLPDFIAKHTLEKLCLPCLLKLPKASESQRGLKKKADSQSQLAAAACDLVFLGTIEVLSPTGDTTVTEAVRQLKALDLPTLSIVNFKASLSGVTITDNANGLLSKRNYPLHTITHCGLDPTDTRWDFPHLGDSVAVKNKPCFGIVHRMQDSPGYTCSLFGELDPHQPVSNIVAYMKRLLQSTKRT